MLYSDSLKCNTSLLDPKFKPPIKITSTLKTGQSHAPNILLIPSISLDVRIQIETRKEMLELLGSGIDITETLWSFNCAGKKY